MTEIYLEDESKLKGFFDGLIDCVLTKWIGCFAGLASALLMIISIAVYGFMPDALFNFRVIVYGVLGVVLFVALSLFKRTSRLAPIFLMLSTVLCLGGFVNAGGMMDYVTTHFFAGFSMEAFNSLPFAFRFSVVVFILNIIIASVAMYLPQNRDKKFGEGKKGAAAENSEELPVTVAESNATEEDKGENV